MISGFAIPPTKVTPTLTSFTLDALKSVWTGNGLTTLGPEIALASEASAIDGTGVTSPLVVDTGFSASNVNDVNVGVSFVGGIAKPEIKKYSGDIIYIDNRNKVTRSSTQKEEIKIVIEF